MNKYDPHRRVGCCPNPSHVDDTPSCSYNPKTYSFHCFGCGFNSDIIEAYMLKCGLTFNEACKKLFEEADIPYDFTECGVKSKTQYRYPKPEYDDNKDKVYTYWATRGISKETIDYLDIQQDKNGNTLFQYRDLNDVFVTCKVRQSRKVEKKEKIPKCWYLPETDITHILYNINKINTTQPLIICTGEGDCAAAIECGYLNSTSIDGGDQNTMWISECWDWLNQFNDIILVHDNDESGRKYIKEVTSRLGEYRVKVVDIPDKMNFTASDGQVKLMPIKDLNELLFIGGKDAVREAIENAKESEIPAIVDYTDVAKFDMSDVDGFTSGFEELDSAIDKFYVGSTTILTGIAGCVDSKTEYFNGSGWKKISDFTVGEKVLQYNSDGTASLVVPECYIKTPCSEFWEIKNERGINQCVSDEHNLVYITSKGNIHKCNAVEFIERHNASPYGAPGKFITTFTYSGDGMDLTDEQIRVMCAVICDGNFQYKTRNTCRVNIKREDKKERLKCLLNNARISFREKKYNPSDPQYSTFLFEAPLHTKIFTSEWYGCTNHQLNIIADEAMHWDGANCKGRRSFSSNNKENTDFMQFAFSNSGLRSRVSAYDRRGQTKGEYIRKSIDYRIGATDTIFSMMVTNKEAKENIKKVTTGDGFKYCFTVPSGMLVLRREGVINITGNSGKSSLISTLACQSVDQGKPVFIYSGELSNPSLKNWVDCVHAGQRNLNEYPSQNGASKFYKIKPDAFSQINKFYKGKMFFYRDGFSQRTDKLFSTMEGCVRRYGVKTVILDNMTSVDLDNNDDNKWQKQDEFIRSIIEFSKKWQVACIVVLHPKKMDMVRKMTIFDLQGCVSAVNLAHRVISLYRVNKKDKEGTVGRNGKLIDQPIKYDVVLDILKDRYGSGAGKEVGLYYDVPSKRFFTSAENLDFRYAWDTKDYTGCPIPFGIPQFEEANEVFGDPITGGS